MKQQKMEHLKREYESIVAPKRLRKKVLFAMKRQKRITALKYCSAVAASFLVISAIAVNSIPNLAHAMSNIPVLKEVVGVLTLGRFATVENDKKINDKAFYPQVEEFRGELLKGYINQSLKKVTDKYTKNPVYTNVEIDYTVTRNDEKILSVLFTGSAVMTETGNTIPIMDSVNIDVADSTNEITYDNLIKDTPEAKAAVHQLLDAAARSNGIANGLDAEGIRVYFSGENIVFFYMPADDSAKDFVQLTIPESEISNYLNTSFGVKPAS